jgi:threonylcarbamoyladenosine tRNA methylthiotransferase MtaB
MDGVVPKAQRAQRSKMLHILSEKKKRHFYEENIGATGNVLLEGEDHDGYMFGFTENYVKVKLPYDEAHVNKMFKVQYTEIAPDGIMRASILEEIPTAAKAVTA